MKMLAFVSVICSIGCTGFAEELLEAVPEGIVEEFMVVPDSEEATEIPIANAAPEEASVEDSTEEMESELNQPANGMVCEPEVCLEMKKKWYLELKPAYFYFADEDMRSFYGDGGFTFRAETGCQFWGPFIVWLDAGYFQKTGESIGGAHPLEIKLATITLGLKLIHSFSSWASVYAGAGPRLFMMMMKNDSPFVRGDDNEIGIGAAVNGGVWLFPIPQWPNFFLDLFADYAWKKMKVEDDEISSIDYGTVNLSGLTAGLGIGIRF
jgi:hypothetical protein